MDHDHQAPLSTGFSRQEYWTGLPCPPPGDLPNPGIESRSPALQADSLLPEPPGKPEKTSLAVNTVIAWILPTEKGKSLPHPKVMVFVLKTNIVNHWCLVFQHREGELESCWSQNLRVPRSSQILEYHTWDWLLAQPSSRLRGSQFRCTAEQGCQTSEPARQLQC